MEAHAPLRIPSRISSSGAGRLLSCDSSVSCASREGSFEQGQDRRLAEPKWPQARSLSGPTPSWARFSASCLACRAGAILSSDVVTQG